MVQPRYIRAFSMTADEQLVMGLGTRVTVKQPGTHILSHGICTKSVMGTQLRLLW